MSSKETRSKQPPPSPPPPVTTEKVMQTYRMPRDLVDYLKKQAQDRGLDLTAFVNRVLDGYRTYYGLPLAVSEVLESDREALAMGKLEYFLHVFYRRSEAIQANKPGFDNPTAKRR
jgi:hypothetical protein